MYTSMLLPLRIFIVNLNLGSNTKKEKKIVSFNKENCGNVNGMKKLSSFNGGKFIYSFSSIHI